MEKPPRIGVARPWVVAAVLIVRGNSLRIFTLVLITCTGINHLLRNVMQRGSEA